MRASILLASVALALAGCGKKDQADAGNVEQGLTAESIVANDVTAIDAVTADAANMAADVNIDFTNAIVDENAAASTSNTAGPAKPRPRAPQGAKSPPVAAPIPTPQPAPAPAPAPATNATE